MMQYNKQDVLDFISNECNSMADYNRKRSNELPTLFKIRSLGWMKDCLNTVEDNRKKAANERRQKKALEFIEKATKLHNGKYDYSKVVYIDCKKPVEIICPKHGSFLQTPEEHLRISESGYVTGCSVCGREHQHETKKYWTKEKIFEFASNYKTSQEFKRASIESHNGAYSAAQRMGLLKELREIWESVTRRDYWTEERCIEFAKTCITRSDVQKKNGRVYILLKYVYKKMDVLFPDDNRDPNAKIGAVYAYVWENLKSVYIGSTPMWRLEIRDNEHHKKTDTVYKFANKHNVDIPKQIVLKQGLAMEEMLDYETIYFPQEYRERGYTVINKLTRSVGRRSAGKWNKQSCYDEAKKYTTLQDFIKFSPSAYDKAKERSWLEEYTWLEDVSGPYWTEERCREEALKYNTIEEFRDCGNAAYQIACKNEWIDSYTWINRKKAKNNYWTKERCYEEAKKYVSFKEFKNGSSGAYHRAYDEGWLKDYDWLDVSNAKWRKERCREEASKYPNRSQFWINSRSAYNRSRKKVGLTNSFRNNIRCLYTCCYKFSLNY